ncbi:MAG TPA: hypothetical protein ENI57_08710 [Ignavibacteria bacterium]|nr:hypothetical protein [Ignavibacteria bacterium]
MKIIKKLSGLFQKKQSASTPVLIIRKESDDSNIKEYKSIEEAIADLENDPNVSTVKIEKLRASLNNLKNKTSIKIRNGEII